jgi:heme/copper-type cytochrome/quinol oxidase subunit 3
MGMKRLLTALSLAAVLGFCGATPAAARQAPARQTELRDVRQLVVQDAEWVRNELHGILRGYPRSVGEILRRDPSLMGRPDYMAPYPQLVAFLEQHPDIPRNAEFYFEGYGAWGRQPYDPEFEALGVLLGGMAGFFLFTTVLGVFAWLVRAVIQHRRWLKTSQVQAEVHGKLMERMHSNEELLAYVQSPAGRRFLEASTPAQPDMENAPSIGAPVGPIIWSMMAGIVLTTVGIGFRLAGMYIGDDSQRAFIVVGVIIIALGVGFMLASLMAYLVSSRLGLFPQRTAAESQSNA